MDWKSELEISDDSIDDIRLVGFTYIKQGCYELAINFFNALTIFNPDNIYDLQTLGALYLQDGKFLKSLEYLDKALKINPQNDLASLNRARALSSLGYRKEALFQVNNLKNIPNKRVAMQAKALMKAYS